MSHQIDYSTIGWEQYEDLCVSLWFDEGYTNIQPMGRRREGGRDAIFVDAETDDVIIFQFKQWVAKYNASTLRSMIRDAAKKVAGYKPKKFILNSVQEPNADVNDWISSLEAEMGFEIEYYDRSWTDLRLNNQRQDLRRDYFGLGLAHHTQNSLVSTCRVQVARTITSLSGKYVQEIYIQRDAERKFSEYTESDKTGLAIVDRSGRGKTNLLCSLSNDLQAQGKIVILVRGDAKLTNDSGLERLIVDAMGYDTSEYQAHLRDVSRLLKEHNETCYVLLDSLSETDDLAQANRSLRNLLIRLSELGCFKLCFTCRDVVWNQVGYDLPKELLFVTGSNMEERYELYIDDFGDEELETALALYHKQYNVDFTLAADARNQLKHPLLLRLFCEAHRDQSLGQVSAIPVAQTFEVYLDAKIAAIMNRSGGKYQKNTILSLLRNIAGQMWSQHDTKALLEEQWAAISPQNMTFGEREELLQMLAQEGIISFREEPITLSRSLRIVFDELREYLLLHYLLSRLPERIQAHNTICEIAIAALEHFRVEDNNPEAFTFLSLVGMLLPVVSERQDFLQRLLAWDFQTFCSCLIRIPPLGPLNRCGLESLQLIAEQLRVWFPATMVNVVNDEVRTSLNYWEDDPLEKLVVTVKITASPECKEITYYYRTRKSNHGSTEMVEVNQITGYPTFRLSIGTEHERVELHDPEKGIIMPSWHTAGAIQRTINSSFPPAYIGESFNVPERMSLYDTWGEIPQLLTDKINRFPLLPTFLSEEREEPSLPRGKTANDLDDNDLSQYLSDLFVKAISCYVMLVERYFFQLRNVLNLAAQMPCSFYYVTDRSSVKYGFTPVESKGDMRFSYRVLDSSHDIADPKWKVTVHDDESVHEEMIIEDFVREALKKMNRLRPPIQPINRVEPINKFFSTTPINDLVNKWLLADFRVIFGF